MTATTDLDDPHATHAGVRLVAASPHRAVVEQPDLVALENHVGIRHASALYAAACAASRALVRTALGDRRDAAELWLADSEISYVHVPLGLITTVAEPAGGDWDALERERAEVHAAAISTNANGTTVAVLHATWRIAPLPRR